MKVLHVFDHSLPHHSGYSFRSESIVNALRDLGVDTVQLTGPKHVHDGTASELVDEIEFLRCSSVITGNDPLSQLRCVIALRRRLSEVIVQARPDVIHCHSPCLNGLAALGLGVPVVYEVRACWEDAAVSSGTTTEGSLRYRISRSLESFVARAVDEVVVICEGLQDEFVSRGIDAQKLSVVGNAINSESLISAEPSAANDFRKALGLDGRRIVGFFGSFYRYEGLDLLIESFPRVLAEVPNAVILLAGGGEAEPELRATAHQLGIESQILFLGRIAHDEIAKCYAIADVMVFPRHKEKLTDMVTPLKPLEAMYLRSVVVASDVGGHRELVRSRDTGMLFEAGNVDALAAALVEVLTNDDFAERIKGAAYQYVMEHRVWSLMAARYRRIYERMTCASRSMTERR